MQEGNGRQKSVPQKGRKAVAFSRRERSEPLWTADNRSVTQTVPGKALPTAVTVSLKLPFQRDPALGADRERSSLLSSTKKNDLSDRHGNTERKLLWLRQGGNTEKLVRSQPKAETHPLKNEERGTAFPSDDPAEIAGGTAAAFGGALAAEFVDLAKLEKGTGKIG